MTFLSKFTGPRYDAFDAADSRSHTPTESESASPRESIAPASVNQHVPDMITFDKDMISFTDDESASARPPEHDRTLSDESVSTHHPASGLIRPRRAAPPPPETMLTHLRRLHPNENQQRDHVARAILGLAVREWSRKHPMPVALDRMRVQSFKHVHLQDDVAGRSALICTAGLRSRAEAAEHFWSVARDAILEVYIVPRPLDSDPARSAYYPAARAELQRANPELYAWVCCIEKTDFSRSHHQQLLADLASVGQARVAVRG